MKRRERGRQVFWAGAAVVLAAALLAWGNARPFAGCWNDGSRLATIECLLDHQTFTIDHSIFVTVPPEPGRAPYPADDPGLLQHGTQDKLYINGHFYSDKSPVPAVLMTGAAWVWEWATGNTVRDDPAGFCLMMTLAFSGVPYVLAVLAVYRLSLCVGLRLSLALTVTASFALATTALPYARHVNNHILLLAVTATLAAEIAAATRPTTGHPPAFHGGFIGCLAGLGYTIDLGAGPVLLLSTALFVATRRRWVYLVSFAAAALPWLLLHHALNYAVGGCWRPANALAEYFRWPGSPFNAGNLTGGWPHSTLGGLFVYAAALLLGKRGFVGHNLPLFLLVPLAWRWWQDGRWRRPGVLWALMTCGGTWVVYAANSNNSSGQCLSIRWFVPLLAPAYYMLALGVRASRAARTQLLLLSAWGVLLGALMGEGPWSKHMVPGFWPLQAVALLTWMLLRRRSSPSLLLPEAAVTPPPAAAFHEVPAKEMAVAIGSDAERSRLAPTGPFIGG
jgi:hypothetical protein